MREYISPPQAFHGTETEKLDQVYRYLFRLSEQLNSSADAVDQEFVTIQGQVSSALKMPEEASADLAEQYTSLKSLIIKTADIVSSEVDVLRTTLESDYVAQSEWGEYKQSITNEIEATATGVVQSFKYDEQLSSLNNQAADFSEYKTTTLGYIRQGIIGFKDGGEPIIGIAIGQDITEVTVTQNSKEYSIIDKSVDMATYTADKITFWQNGVEAGSFSSGVLVVNSAIKLGNWQLSSNNFALTWIGGPVS